jgi:hypothetical protein
VVAALTVAGLAMTGLMTGVPAFAVTDGGGSAAPSITTQVVATGLNTPRGLVYDRLFHRVLVAEAGVAAGNTSPCGLAERGLPMCLGHTGSILQYSEFTGSTRRIVTGLPSTALQGGPTVVIGLHDLSLHHGRLTAVFGLLGNKPYRDSLGPGAALLGTAATISLSGRVEAFGDIVSFEDTLHPGRIESDPFGVLSTPLGAVVANAGGPDTNRGNDLLLVRRDGTITQLAQFPEHPSVTDPTDLIRSVPTSVAIGPDGAFYVGELSGAPFYPGEARVWRVVPGQPATIVATGFTTIIDLAFDERGRLIVLQTSADPFDADGDGALIRVERDGTRTVLAGPGLANPGGVALAGHGVFYVTTRTASGGGVGELVRIRVRD